MLTIGGKENKLNNFFIVFAGFSHYLKLLIVCIVLANLLVQLLVMLKRLSKKIKWIVTKRLDRSL